MRSDGVALVICCRLTSLVFAVSFLRYAGLLAPTGHFPTPIPFDPPTLLHHDTLHGPYTARQSEPRASPSPLYSSAPSPARLHDSHGHNPNIDEGMTDAKKASIYPWFHFISYPPSRHLMSLFLLSCSYVSGEV